MNYDLSRRFKTQASENDIIQFMEDSFRRTSDSVYNNGRILSVGGINTTFGSINRTDKTVVELKSKDNDALLVAHVEYKPSGWFWIFLICGLFTTVCWLIPIGFYFYQKNVVKTAIEEIFNRIEDEFRDGKGQSTSAKAISSGDLSDQLEKLAELKAKGILSDEEFASQKAKILENM